MLGGVSVTTVYLNGRYLPLAEAVVPVEDRGFLFADGIYEVIRYYGGRPFAMDGHLQRLQKSADGIRLQLPMPLTNFGAVADELVRRAGLGDATVYLQVTRGHAGPRLHTWPAEGVAPTVWAVARPVAEVPEETIARGAAAITVPDQRWARCDLKTLSLLPNCLARQQALEAGVQEAIFVRDGVAIESSAANLFAVFDGEVITYPRSNYILAGITRQAVLTVAPRLGLAVREDAVMLADLYRADEVFTAGTTAEVQPITRVDGRPIGDGRAGPVAMALLRGLRAHIRETCGK